VPHALLLHGPEGVGKLQLAEQFAQLLLCEAAKPRETPCGKCDGCRWFLAGHHPDVRFVEPEAIARRVAQEDGEGAEKSKAKPSLEIKIDQVRGLADFVNLASHRGGKRIVVLHPAEAMNVPAANAVLKSLEEPPGSALFVLVSHRAARLLPTVRSRCVPVPVPLPPADAAQAWLKEQGIENAARRLAFAGGAPLKALEDAKSGRGERADQIQQALSSGNLDRLQWVRDREGLELLAEVLQRRAFDQALGAFGLPAKYGSDSLRKTGSRREWLACLRKLGPDRALARHPVNPGLHAIEMLQSLPAK
jgi:DNA polymerase-3 subunit delta'